MLTIKLTEGPGNIHVARSFSEANALLRRLMEKRQRSSCQSMKVTVLTHADLALLEEEIDLSAISCAGRNDLHAYLLASLARRLSRAASCDRAQAGALVRQLATLN